MKKRRQRIHHIPRSKFDWFKKVNIFKYLSILLMILFVYCIPAFIKILIKIDKVECVSQLGPCDYSFQLGNYSHVKKQIDMQLRQDVRLSSYIVQYKIPSTIKIEINLKKPIYSIKNSNGTYFLLDKNGLIIGISQESESTSLLSDSNYSVGQITDEKTLFALRLLEKINIVTNVYDSKITNNYLTTHAKNDILILFPLDSDIDLLAGSLKLIFSRLNEGSEGIRMEDVREIDFRFKNPIIR